MKLQLNSKHSYPERQRDRPDEASTTCSSEQGAKSGRRNLEDERRSTSIWPLLILWKRSFY